MKGIVRLGLYLVLLSVTVLEASCCGGGFCNSCPCAPATCPTNTAGRCCCAEGPIGSPRTIFIPRSIGDDLTIMLFKYTEYGKNECFWGNLDFNYTYERSFKPEMIANSILPCSRLNFVGSQVTTPARQPTDLLADYFGMATTTNTSITFCPLIQYHRFNIGLTLGLNNLTDGLWLQINMPIVHTKWELNQRAAHPSCNTPGCTEPCGLGTLPNVPFPLGYMNAYANPTSPLVLMIDALQGKPFGEMTTGWLYGKFCGCPKDDTKVATVDIKLGYNFFECPDYHVGLYLKYDAPTGTEMDCCQAECLFKPVIGDDHHKLGGGVTAHVELWNCDDAHILSLNFEAYAVHMFKRMQVRSFDFVTQGVLSRYMLLKVFNADGSYANNLINAINYVTRRAPVSVDVQGEALFELRYKNECGFAASAGVDFYGKSCENICSTCGACNPSIDDFKYGFKGCAPIEVPGYTTGPAGATEAILAPGTPATTYTLHSTQSNATAYTCGTTDNAQALYAPAAGVNNGFIYVDTRSMLTTPITTGTLVSTIQGLSAVGQESSKTAVTVNPVGGAVTGWTDGASYISPSSLNLLSGAAPSQVMYKVYAHADYYWMDCDWTPNIYGGASVEVGNRHARGELYTWGIFIGGGISF